VSFGSLPHRLSADDVLPAEGAQAVVDTTNDNIDALYVQHDRRSSEHLDMGPFLVGRVLLQMNGNYPDNFAVLQRSGFVEKVARDHRPPVDNADGYIITMAEYCRPSGGNAMVRYLNGTVTLTEIAATCTPYWDNELRVTFATNVSRTKVSYIHVLVRGVLV
jgi:hypothetical protein